MGGNAIAPLTVFDENGPSKSVKEYIAGKRNHYACGDDDWAQFAG